MTRFLLNLLVPSIALRWGLLTTDTEGGYAEFTEPDPFGMPDIMLAADDQWKCPCGRLRVGPVAFSHPGFSMQTRCPGCGTIVEHVADSDTEGGSDE